MGLLRVTKSRVSVYNQLAHLSIDGWKEGLSFFRVAWFACFVYMKGMRKKGQPGCIEILV